MKTNAFKGLFLLLCFCFLSCGSKKAKTAEAYPLGASGFPEWIKVAWRVSPEDTMVIVAMVNQSEKDCTLLMHDHLPKYPCYIYYQDNEGWKEVTGQMKLPRPSAHKKKERNYVGANPQSEEELEASNLVKIEAWQILRPGKPVRFDIPFYNITEGKVKKGLYRLTFLLAGRRCHIVFQL